MGLSMSTNEQSLTVNLTELEAWWFGALLKRIGFWNSKIMQPMKARLTVCWVLQKKSDPVWPRLGISHD